PRPPTRDQRGHLANRQRSNSNRKAPAKVLAHRPTASRDPAPSKEPQGHRSLSASAHSRAQKSTAAPQPALTAEHKRAPQRREPQAAKNPPANRRATPNCRAPNPPYA